MSEKQSPETIWLQPHNGEEQTWCQDKINDDDTEYIKASQLTEARREIEELKVGNSRLQEYADTYARQVGDIGETHAGLLIARDVDIKKIKSLHREIEELKGRVAVCRHEFEEMIPIFRDNKCKETADAIEQFVEAILSDTAKPLAVVKGCISPTSLSAANKEWDALAFSVGLHDDIGSRPVIAIILPGVE